MSGLLTAPARALASVVTTATSPATSNAKAVRPTGGSSCGAASRVACARACFRNPDIALTALMLE